MKPLKVLSLFDGISCGQVALERAGIPVEVYYSSEIDKYAIQVTQKNYPNTIQIGDVTKIDFTQFIGKVDLIMGGSPCQNLSSLGNGKGLFGNESSLFYYYLKSIEIIKPKYFLLENVKMKKCFEDEISDKLGVKPILINSDLVSAQNRPRLYWTNIKFTMPYDKGITLQDVLDKNSIFDLKLNNFVSRKTQDVIKKYGYLPKYYNPYNTSIVQYKSPCQTCYCGSSTSSATVIISNKNDEFRKLTPIECERLQTLPDNYTEGITNSQRYKAIGNGWTVDVIAHIFKNLKEDK